MTVQAPGSTVLRIDNTVWREYLHLIGNQKGSGMTHGFWVRTQSGQLVNLACCTTVQKVKDRSNKESNDGTLFFVQALEATETGTITLAKGLTEKQADELLVQIWRVIPVEESFDVSSVVNSQWMKAPLTAYEVIDLTGLNEGGWGPFDTKKEAEAFIEKHPHPQSLHAQPLRYADSNSADGAS